MKRNFLRSYFSSFAEISAAFRAKSFPVGRFVPKGKIEKPLEDYSQYLLLEYRQKLLRVLLFTCMLILAGLTLTNLNEWINNPATEWGVYNLVSDGIVLLFFQLCWWLNEKGQVELVGWSFGLLVFFAVPRSYSLPYITQTLLIMAIPVTVSSFAIRPWASFVFAALVMSFYTFTYVQNPGTFVFDPFSLMGLGLFAVGAFAVSTMLNRIIRDLVRSYDETIQGWAAALETRDSETLGHSQRVVDLTLQLASDMGIRHAELFHIRRGVLLHDIGKMGIPDAILLKQGPLTDEEREVMRKHPDYARHYLSKVSYLAPALDIPYCHHEKWDGTGYPRGLQGEQTPLAARIFAVVDVWDALTNDRPYHAAWTHEAALAYIRENAGTHFDPQVVEAFIAMMQRKSGHPVHG